MLICRPARDASIIVESLSLCTAHVDEICFRQLTKQLLACQKASMPRLAHACICLQIHMP